MVGGYLGKSFLLGVVFLVGCGLCQDERILGLQEMANSIWMEGPNAGASLGDSGAVQALDAMLLLLNSRKLNRRQAPSTCPYCPYNYPCPSGCPSAPPQPSVPCRNDCVNKVGVPGPVGPPGPPGVPGVPFIVGGGGGGSACRGPQGQPGACMPGNPGSPGIPGTPGTCQKANGPGFTLHALYSTFTSYFSCPLRRSACPHSAYQLLSRLQRLEVQLYMLGAMKTRLTAATDELSSLRIKYMEKRKPGPRGLPGNPGRAGVKGVPGYDGVPGKCRNPFSYVRLPPGRPGKPGPKGEPGPQGDKICNCDGGRGDPGQYGLPSFGEAGAKGYKGAKGFRGVPARNPVG